MVPCGVLLLTRLLPAMTMLLLSVWLPGGLLLLIVLQLYCNCLLCVQWMAAVDTIITKAGPGTIAEALISGLPILLNGNVPCQVRALCTPCVTGGSDWSVLVRG